MIAPLRGLSLGLLAWIYAGYPLWLLSRRHAGGDGPRRVEPQKPGSGLLPRDPPTVTLFVFAHNEAAVLGRRIDDALRTDYPRDRFRIVVLDDGSTDATAEIVRGFADAGVVLERSAVRRGKMALANEAVPRASSEIVVLTDANISFDPDAVKHLVARFSDPAIGAVCGELIFREDGRYSSASRGESLYWRYECALKRAEAASGSLVAVNGAILAFRRALFSPRPEDTVCDDLAIALSMIPLGYRVAYEPRARAYEAAVPRTRDQFRRKVRLVAGGFREMARALPLFLPGSHVRERLIWRKIARWLAPVPLLGLLVGTWRTRRESAFSKALLAAQIAFYAAPLLESGVRTVAQTVTRDRDVKIRWTTIPFYFVLVNLAALCGLAKFLSGRASPLWRVTPR